jgi:hypothetical protein
MRIKVILAIAVGLLFCSLSTLEFPELMSLSDNTSNDFSVAVFRSDSGMAVRKQMPRSQRGPRLTATGKRQSAALDHIGIPVVSVSSDNFLRLFCIQRT